MEALKISVSTYIITTVVAFAVAFLFHMMAILVKKLNLTDDEAPAATPSSAAQAQDLRPIAIAIAAAKAKHEQL